MKKRILLIVLALTMLCVLSACKISDTTEPTLPPAPEPADHIGATGTLSLDMQEWATIQPHTDAQDVFCRVVQGSCTDGTYLYVALNDGRDNTRKSVSAICKYELSSGKLVATYDKLNVSHCNDMTYNHDTGELIIVHCMPDGNIISIFDSQTMQLKEKKPLKLHIYAIAYDPYEKCYWAGVSVDYKFAKLDLSFERIGTSYVGFDSGYVKQGMDVDSKYLYFVQYDQNTIQVYTKDGQYLRQIDLPVTEQEAESICHVGDVFYISYYTFPQGGKIYRTVFEN